MGQDQVWALWLGLRLVNEFVDESDIQMDIIDITHTIAQAMHYHDDFGQCLWLIRNPATNTQVYRGSDATFLSWAFATVAHDITGQDEHCGSSNPPQGLIDFWASQASVPNQLNSDNGSNAYGIALLTALTNETFSNNAYSWLVDLNTSTTGYWEMDNGLFPHLILVNQSIYQITGTPEDASFYESFLNTSPPCGAYHYKIEGTNIELYSDPPWHSLSLFCPWNCIVEKENGRGHFNMLDYMLLYNLYFLNYQEANEPYLFSREDFPIYSPNPSPPPNYLIYGNDLYPAIVQAARQIDVKGELSQEAHVSYYAGQKVRLLPGFHAHKGADVLVHINPSLNNPIYYNKTYEDPCDGDYWVCPENRSNTKYESKLIKSSIKVREEESRVSSLKENNNKIESLPDSINIYPNPFSNEIHVISSAVIQNLIVSDLRGKIYLDNSVNANYFYCALENLSKGVYIVTIKTDRMVYNCKLIKQ